MDFVILQDWVQYEEIADVEERVVSNYFENMIQSIQSAIGPSSAGGGAASTSAGQKPQDTPIASSNDEENVSATRPQQSPPMSQFRKLSQSV